MSIWINKSALLCGFLICTGCVEPGADFRERPVLSGAIVVAAPNGYCIDPGGVLESNGTALALIGRCSSGTAQAAILTVAVGGPGSGQGLQGGQANLATFFATQDGRRALSRSGDFASVTVREIGVKGDAVLIHLTDVSPNSEAPGQTESWRAILPVSGRLVSLTVTGAGNAALSPQQGKDLLTAFVSRMKAANPGASG
jgi:hypothetical protein